MVGSPCQPSKLAFKISWSSTTLTHWGRVTHICVANLTIIASDNGLSPGRRHAIIWTNAGILLIGTLGTNLSDILIEIHIFSFKKMRLKVSSAKWRPFCFGLNVLTFVLMLSAWCGFHVFGCTLSVCHFSSHWVGVCLLWSFVVIEHMVNSESLQISPSRTQKYP